MGADDDILAEQLAYYRARADEYDQVYAQRADIRDLLRLVEELPIAGDVLELACGTGQWTPLLARRAASVTAVDASPEALAIARTRTASPKVTFVQADLFSWRPPRRWDTVFFAFWLSHVPPARLPAFWSMVAAALTPDGRAVLVDDGFREFADEVVVMESDVPSVGRRLDAGAEYRVVKVFHDAPTLADDLAALGWSATVRSEGGRFIVGVGRPPAPRPER